VLTKQVSDAYFYGLLHLMDVKVNRGKIFVIFMPLFIISHLYFCFKDPNAACTISFSTRGIFPYRHST
jgi:hypothetical protein